jgi:hypothetical protein
LRVILEPGCQLSDECMWNLRSKCALTLK